MKRFVTLMFTMALALSLVIPSFAWQDTGSQESKKAPAAAKEKKEKKSKKEKKAKKEKQPNKMEEAPKQ